MRLDSKKVGRKIYLEVDVLTAARQRISDIFDQFTNIVCSLSGGKDSTVMLHLALAEARKRGRKVNVFHLDQEAEYASTTELIEEIMKDESVIPHWYQVPCYMTNTASYSEDLLYAWGEGEKWMREKHPMAIHKIEGDYPQRFYTFIEWFEQQWDAKTTCFLVGLRAEESLNRFRAVIKNPGYNGWNWTTKTKELIKAYPLYDWTFEDIWIYIVNNDVKYNRIYDFLHASGVDIQEMRVSNLVHEKSFKCLTNLQKFEPDTYNKLMERVKGIHIAARYAKEETMYSNKKLPKRFKTWLEYRDFLLETSPIAEDKKERFRKRFAKQAKNESVYKQQCKQILLNDWENSMPVVNKQKKVKKTIDKWRELL